MIEPTSQEELGYTDEEYRIYSLGFCKGAIKGLEDGKKSLDKFMI